MNESASERGHWFARLRIPLAVFVVTRAGLFLVVYLGLVFIQYDDATKQTRVYPRSLVQGFYGWDSGWYGHIAADGYNNEPNSSGQRDTTFWPLYPLAVRAALTVFGDVRVAGVVVSNAAFLCGLLLLFALARDKLGEDVATRTVILICVYPFSFYFSAAYTESLFFFTCVAAFYSAENENWLLAGLCAAAAGATRSVGILTAAGLATLYLEKIDFDLKRLRPNILWLALAIIGPLSFMLFLEIRFGDPLVFQWGRNVPGWQAGVDLERFLRQMRNLSTLTFNQDNLSIIFGFMGLVLSIASWKYAGRAYCVWSALSIMVASYSFTGLGRHVAPLFPVFMALAGLLNRDGWFAAVCFWFITLLTLLSLMFSHGCWVT